MRDLDLRVVIKEKAESEKTDQDRESQPIENLRAAMTVFSDHGFHGCEHYPPITHLTRAKGHETRRCRMMRARAATEAKAFTRESQPRSWTRSQPGWL